jgi:hypothetical protein
MGEKLKPTESVEELQTVSAGSRGRLSTAVSKKKIADKI